MEIDLSNHKKLRYQDYKLNNDPRLMKKYPRKKYPRLVDYLFDHAYHDQKLTEEQRKRIKNTVYHALWRQGLFHSCQA